MMVDYLHKTTLVQLADALGVSASTVSAALSSRYRQRRIPEHTVARIRAAAREVGYVPDMHARRTRRGGRAEWVIALISAIEAPIGYLDGLVRTIMNVASDYGDAIPRIQYAVELFPAGRLSDCTAVFDGRLCHGAVITNTRAEDDAFLAETEVVFPVVLWGRDVPGYSAVRDAGTSGMDAASILVEAGCRRLAVIKTPYLTMTTRQRFDGFLGRAAELGVAVDVIATDAISESDGERCMAAYLSDGGTADGLFTLLDTYAPGAYRALHMSGLKIPGDVKVIGHDNRSVAAYLDPPLSTFDLANGDMRLEAARMLLRSLTGEQKTPEQRIYEVSPVLRESTGHAS